MSATVTENRIHCIACGVFRTDLEEILPTLSGRITVEYLEGGLHAEPDELRRRLEQSISRAPREADRVVLLYGVCGRGIVGLKSEHHTLVVPKVHDCISLFLGGAEEYRKQFSHAPGTFYTSAGWYEEQVQPRGRTSGSVGSAESGVLPGRSPGYPRQYVDTTDKTVLEKRFGKDNAEEISTFLDSWRGNYSRSVFIDTGAAGSDTYESYARGLAEENGWTYTRLTGSQRLIRNCFSPVIGDEEILTVPPGREILFDSAAGVISSAAAEKSVSGDRTLVIPSAGPSVARKGGGEQRTVGLGIDAGGTYTDAVVFDFSREQVLSRAKALTTKWKYSEGIMEAVGALPAEQLAGVRQVSISTTLVTNAIVESRIQPVGLLIMPPGNMEPGEIHHFPCQVIRGRVSISGDVTQEADPEEIRSAARRMVSAHGVRAFAVSGYGASVNPELELQVKQILREETGLDVCCGHELSGTLNFYVRARTAVLNAGVIPIMEEFLAEMERALGNSGIDAPVMVVKGDGSVMSHAAAREYPLQTALSGPAASMAGALYLTGRKDGIVIDVGGTTSDIGFLEDRSVAVCEEGARIGRWKTHVRAVDMLTTGLGGDSEILYERLDWTAGPRRITPVSWLAEQHDLSPSLREASLRQEDFRESTRPLQWLFLTGKQPDFPVSSREQRILDALKDGPLMIRELCDRIGAGTWRLVKTGRLERTYCVQRAGFTPTDLFHARGRLSLWNAGAAAELFRLLADCSGRNPDALAGELDTLIADTVGLSLLSRVFPDLSDPAEALTPVLKGGNRRMAIRPELHEPVIGLGAPAELILSDAVRRLGGELILPENRDVANAVGAVTSRVAVTLRAAVVPTPQGEYRIQGLEEGLNLFPSLEEAEAACIDGLTGRTRRRARKAGTREEEVSIRIEDRTARTAGGEELLLERVFTSGLSGIPDCV